MNNNNNVLRLVTSAVRSMLRVGSSGMPMFVVMKEKQTRQGPHSSLPDPHGSRHFSLANTNENVMVGAAKNFVPHTQQIFLGNEAYVSLVN